MTDTLPISGRILYELEERAKASGCTVDELLEGWLSTEPTKPTPLLDQIQRQFINTIRIALAVTDLDGIVQYWNPFAESLYGWRSEEIVGKHLVSMLHVNVTAQQFDEVMACLSAGEQWLGEFTTTHKDGHKMTAFVINYPLMDEDNNLIGIMGSAVDITQQHLEQKQLLETQTRLQLALASANAGIWDWRLDQDETNDTIISPEYAEILGYDPDTFQQSSLNWMSMVHPDDLPHVVLDLAAGEPYPQRKMDEYRIQHKEGHYIWIQDRIQVVDHFPDQSPKRIIGTIMDITERKQAELELAASEARFRAFMDNFTQGYIYLKDAQLNHIYANQSSLDFLNISLEDYVGKPASDFFDAEVAEILESADRDVLATGQPQQLELELTEKDGSTSWLHDIKFSFRDADGNPMIGGIALDITDEKRAQDDLRKSEARYRTILKNFPNGIIALYDRDLRYTIVGGERAQEEGSPASQLVGKRLRDLYPQEVYERDEPALLASLDGERTESIVEYRGQHLRVMTAPIRDADDTIIGGMVMSQDITNLKNTQNELEQANQKLALAIDTAKLGIMEYDAKTGKVDVNQRLVDLLGMSMDEVHNIDSWYRYMHPDDQPASRERFSRVTKEGKSASSEIRIVGEDNKTHHIKVQSRVIKNEHGEVENVNVTMLDITDIVESRQKLAESQARLDSLIETHSAYIVRTDIHGKYTYANPIFFRHFASHRYKTVDDIIGVKSTEMIIPEDHEKTFATVLRCIKYPGTPQQITMRKPHANGDIVYTGWEFVAITNESGRVVEIQCIGIDITDQINLQQALQKTRVQFENTLRSISDYVWSADIVDGKFVYNYFSPVVEQMTGYPPEYFMSDVSAWLNIIHKDDRVQVGMGVADELSGKNVTHEYRIVRSDGGIRWHYGRTSPTFDSEGHLIRVDGVVRDITERKKTEIALQESENRYRTLFDSALFPIVIYDENARIVMLNAYSAKNLGGTPEGIIGKTIGHFIPQNQALTVDRIRQVLATGKPMFVEDKLTLSGEELWYSSAIHPVESSGDGQHYVQIVSFDITELKRAEAAKQRIEEQFRAAVEASLDAFYLMESVRDETGNITDFRILETNDKATQQLGLPHDQLIGGLICDLFPINRTQGFFDLYKKVAETAKPLEQEFYISSNAVGGGWYQHQVVKVGDGIAIMTRDITDRKQRQQLEIDNERMIAQFQKEQERNALIQRIISALSHDVRNSLSIVATSSDILSHHFHKLDDKKRKEKFDTINRHIQFATKLLHDTVNLARGKTDEQPFNPKPINLNTLCQVSIQEVSSAYKSTHQMRFVNMTDVEVAIVDETLISRILLNLLSNAIKYTPADGTILLELDHYEHGVVLRVTDSGVGISENDLNQIFEPFFRCENTKSVDGTGLGLSIVKDCVDEHQGEVFVKSVIGEGTTFTVKLPAPTTV